MTLLIVIASAIVYIFIGMTVGTAVERSAEKKCAACNDKSKWNHCYRDHEGLGFFMGALWPVLPLLTVVLIGLVRSSSSLANRFVK